MSDEHICCLNLIFLELSEAEIYTCPSNTPVFFKVSMIAQILLLLHNYVPCLMKYLSH